MSDISTSLSMPFILPSQAQKHVTHNEALRILDVVTQLSVAADDLNTPPPSPAEGSRYLPDSAATGAWADHDGEIALYENGGWRFFVPRAGWRAYVVNRDTMIVFDGAEWIDLESPELEDIETLGIGMNTTPGVPFAAKLNSALWTALYAADGGNGDLVKTLNKEATTDDAGFVFQQDFQTRGLLGMFGSNNLRLATTSDGTSFRDSLLVENNTGIIEQPQLPRFTGTTNFDNFGPANTWTRIAINDLSYNDQGAFDAASNEFTAPVAGTYLFGATLTFKQDSSSAARMVAKLVMNGTTDVAGSQVEYTGTHVSQRTSLTLQSLAVLAPGDTVALNGYMRLHSGYFMAGRTAFWGFKVG